MMDEDTVVEVSHLSKSFEIYKPDISSLFRFEKMNKVVLEDVNFTIKKGEIVGIMGRNGSGKSTLLKIISGILKETSGEIRIKGKVASIIELSIGLQDDRTGMENIILRGNLYGISTESMKTLVPQIVKYADLGEYINNPVRMYSTGMKSRLAFAIMITVDADIFIIDEALSTGDASFKTKASRHIYNLIKKGKTVIMVSHDQRLMTRVCTRIMELDRGRIVADGDPQTVSRGYSTRYENDIGLLTNMAEAGVPSAQYQLAQRYKNGNEVEKDDNLYRKWLSESAEIGNPNAMCEYADLLVTEHREEAIEYYRRSADEGNLVAMWKYSALISGLDTSVVTDNISMFAKNGNHFDLFRYANLMLKVSFTKSDYEHAFELMKTSADLGNKEAKLRLAMMYARGFGVVQSLDTACDIIRELIKDGHRSTLMLIINGRIADIESRLSASDLFECRLKLAQSGDSRSQFIVAKAFEEGKIVVKNEELAKMWFERYARSKLAKVTLQTVTSIQPDDRKRYHADEMLEFTADSLDARSVEEYAKRELLKRKPSDPEKLFDLCKNVASVTGDVEYYYAECLRLGIGTDQNVKDLFSLYQSAADSGSREAMYAVSLMYKNGLGVKKDLSEYRRYMRMAADRMHPMAKAFVDKWDHINEKRVIHIAYSKANKYKQ